jgi:hypothetical protein
LDNDAQIQLLPNPKKAGTLSWERYERYKLATTLRELIELSTTSTHPSARAAQIAKANADITNDYLRGYILFPQLEHNASAHYVDATKVARTFGTVNIHALFSHREMTLARQKAKAAEERTLSDLMSAHLGDAQAREAACTPLKFHDQIKALWEYDAAIQLSEADLKK